MRVAVNVSAGDAAPAVREAPGDFIGAEGAEQQAKYRREREQLPEGAEEIRARLQRECGQTQKEDEYGHEIRRNSYAAEQWDVDVLRGGPCKVREEKRDAHEKEDE